MINRMAIACAAAAYLSAFASYAADDIGDPPASLDDLFDLRAGEPNGVVSNPSPERAPTTSAQAIDPQSDSAIPDSKADLFGLGAEPEKSDAANSGQAPVLPATRDALFDTLADEVPVQRQPDVPQLSTQSLPLHGFAQAEWARTYASPDHGSKVLGRLELGTQGRWGQGVQWKASGRIDYNLIYDLNDFYQSAVRDDQGKAFQLRETYLDLSAGGLDWRLGRQHIVWGEMVGLFFADVVSAKDLREFILPDFQVLRIPQWAVRAEHFKEDFHAELLWIPFPSYDRYGKPTDFTQPGYGADFYPYPPAFKPVILEEEKPGNSLDHGNFGVRLTQLTEGWDLSGFFYSSMNSAPTLYRAPVTGPTLTFTPRHDRIWQLGGTLGKDFGAFVLKAEAVYSEGRQFNLVTDMADADGVVEQDTLDWAVGFDFNPGSDTRVNVQLFERYFFDHHADIIPRQAETGMSLLLNHKFPGKWEGEALLVHSLNRSDWMLRPKASWGFRPNWKLTLGLDVFGGPPTGLFGQYDQQDRGYLEIRRDF